MSSLASSSHMIKCTACIQLVRGILLMLSNIIPLCRFGIKYKKAQLMLTNPRDAKACRK